MSCIELTQDDFQQDSYIVDWRRHPDVTGKLRPGTPLTQSTCVYAYSLNGATLSIAVNVSQMNDLALSVCRPGFFDACFFREDPLLMARNGSNQPIMLTFNPPIQAVGTYVAASGDFGQEFRGYQYVSLSPVIDGQTPVWEEPLEKRAVISKDEGSCAFLGLQAPQGQAIHAAGFDVTWLPGDDPLSVIINTLNFKP